MQRAARHVAFVTGEDALNRLLYRERCPKHSETFSTALWLCQEFTLSTPMLKSLLWYPINTFPALLQFANWLFCETHLAHTSLCLGWSCVSPPGVHPPESYPSQPVGSLSVKAVAICPVRGGLYAPWALAVSRAAHPAPSSSIRWKTHCGQDSSPVPTASTTCWLVRFYSAICNDNYNTVCRYPK